MKTTCTPLTGITTLVLLGGCCLVNSLLFLVVCGWCALSTQAVIWYGGDRGWKDRAYRLGVMAVIAVLGVLFPYFRIACGVVVLLCGGLQIALYLI